MTTYSLRKCKKIFTLVSEREKKKGGKLTHLQQKEIRDTLDALQKALSEKKREEAYKHAVEAELFYEKHFKKSLLEWVGEVGIALTVALVAATIIRSMWFELYEIPTGSMRPTYEEKDRLTVTKTQFGINIPLVTDHLYFNPELVERTGVIIFTSDGLPMTDTDTMYFWIFPAKKRFVKRMIGKPGDTLYFYGGKIYGVDNEGNAIADYMNQPWMESLEHIPFLRFEGIESNYRENGLELSLFHIPVGRVEYNELGEAIGKVWNGKEWVKDLPTNKPHDAIQTYSDLFGMKNFAMSKIVLDKGELFLELNHSPSLKDPEFFGRNLAIHVEKSLLPLDNAHLEAILRNLVTARFTVENGHATAWGYTPSQWNPTLPGVPDGTYEFDKGKGFWVDVSGWRHPLTPDHPLYKKDPKQIQKLYNIGIEFHTQVIPHRYAYFRDGDLYLMGAPVFKKEEEVLRSFVANEEKKQIPFIDYGPPKDLETIKTFGVKVPEKHYMMLGDNHAMSQDSRVFGFVPQENIEGRPSFNLWPPGPRWGFILKSPYAVFVTPRVIIWSVAALCAFAWFVWSRKRRA